MKYVKDLCNKMLLIFLGCFPQKKVLYDKKYSIYNNGYIYVFKQKIQNHDSYYITFFKIIKRKNFDILTYLFHDHTKKKKRFEIDFLGEICFGSKTFIR